MAKKVTIYIEDTEIKLLVTNDRQVVKWASLLLEPALVRDGVIIDEERVADGIKTMFKLEEVGIKRVTVGLGGLNSIFRTINLPELSPSMLPEAVMNEASRVIPVPLDQVYLSYQELPSPKGETHIFLVAYPKNSADALIRTITKAGLKPQMMEMAPLALSRCANAPKAVIINSWLTYLDIVIMSDGIPKLIRSISLPLDTPALQDKLPAIIEEFDRTIAFYNSSYPEETMDSSVPILVCGDLAEEPDSWDSLASRSGYTVSALQPQIDFPEGFTPCKYMVNIGLALKGLLPKGDGDHYSIINIDAMPGAYKPPAINLARIMVPVLVVLAIAAIGWGGVIVKGKYDDTADLLNELTIKELQLEQRDNEVKSLKASEGALKAQLSSLEAANAVLLEEIEGWEDLVALQEEINLEPIEDGIKASSMESMFASLTQGLYEIDDYLAEVVALASDNINLFDVTYGEGMVIISGRALTEGDVFTYAKALRNSTYFDDVIISTISGTTKTEAGEEITVYEFLFFVG